jgi:hypothetical protein
MMGREAVRQEHDELSKCFSVFRDFRESCDIVDMDKR